MTINDIIKPVEAHLKEFDSFFKKSMKSNVSMLDLIIKYMTRKKGKQVRPSIVFLTAEMCGGINQRSFTAAAMVELLHTATLVHDDVVDEAKERRGIASINASWSNKIAVLVGDFLLAKGLLSAIDNEEFGFLKALADAVKRMSEGELLQIQKSKETDVTEETYFRIIQDKTASLIATCCSVGALSATNDEKVISKMKMYGEYLGIAFQIRDDIFDLTGQSAKIGKPVGNDLKEKKMTLPLLYSLRQVPKKESKEIIKLVKNKNISKKEIEQVMKFVEVNGGIEFSEGKAMEYSNKALEMLADFPASVAKDSLVNLARFVVERDN